MTRRTVYIPTNAPAAVALSYGCHLGNVPGWMRIIDDPQEFDSIPNGSLVGAAVWIGSRDVVAAWESVWTPRRLRGGFDFVSPEQEAAMAAWFARHRAEPECLRGRKMADAPEQDAPKAPGGMAERLAAQANAQARSDNQPQKSRWL
jgi:hypothetical protein